MSLRSQYDEIYNSISNEQRKQAVSQMDELGMHEFPGLIDYLAKELNQPEIALDAAKSWFSIKSR